MKKSMKKLGLSLCLVASLGLVAGCGTQSGEQASVDVDTTGETVYKIGISQFAAHPSLDNCKEGFIQGLAMSGYEVGKNIEIKEDNAQGETGTANQIAQNFVANKYDMICAIATPAAQAAYNAAEPQEIPVIFTAVSDPVSAGLAEEGMKITGTSDLLPAEKQIAMIRAFLPEAKTIGIVYNTSESNSISQIEVMQGLAQEYGFTIETIGVNSSGDIPIAVDSILTKVDCINNLTDNLVVSSLAVILDKANAKNIPVFGSEEEQVKAGCVASESINYVNLGIQTGQMAARVLDGEDITTIPFETIIDSEIVINSSAIEQLGLVVPETIQARDVQ